MRGGRGVLPVLHRAVGRIGHTDAPTADRGDGPAGMPCTDVQPSLQFSFGRGRKKNKKAIGTSDLDDLRT